MTLYHFERYKYRMGTDGLNDIDATTLAVQDAADCLLPMGLTSFVPPSPSSPSSLSNSCTKIRENVATEYGITRAQQDAFAASSHLKALAAQSSGHFVSEIAPVTLPDGTVVSLDDGMRAGTTTEGLGKLKPVFKADGSTTAGNASQLTDGAAAVLLVRRSKAEQLGLPILGKFVAFAAAGVPPRVMGESVVWQRGDCADAWCAQESDQLMPFPRSSTSGA